MRLEEAIERATVLLRSLSPPSDPDRLTITCAEMRDNGWLFHYHTSAFVQSQSWLHSLGGDLPIFVPLDGDAITLNPNDIALTAGEVVSSGGAGMEALSAQESGHQDEDE